jgi:toxin ParE1/3/4
VAAAFVAKLRRQCRKLASLPGMLGIARPELGPDIRSMPFHGYVIFLRYGDDALDIVNVLEGHRDIDGHFGGPVAGSPDEGG